MMLTTEPTAAKNQGVNWNPVDYSQVSMEIQRVVANNFLQNIPFASDSTVIDFGCGDGSFTQEVLANRANQVVGVDASEEMVQHAEVHHPSPNVRYCAADISSQDAFERIASAFSNADVIFSANTLHHVEGEERQLQMLRLANRLLKPEGIFAVTFAGDGNLKRLIQCAEEVMKRGRWCKFFESYRYDTFLGKPESYSELLTRCGYDVESISLKSCEFKETKAFWRQWFPCIKGVMRYLEGAADQDKQDFIDAVLDVYASDTVEFVQIEVIARKKEEVYYYQNPEDYSQNASVQKKRAEKNLADFVFEKDDVILDLGCGTADVSKIMASKVPEGKVIALDVNPRMIEKAGEGEQPKNIVYSLQDVRHFSLPEKVDVVTSFACLSWIPVIDHEQIFKQVTEALKPGGRVLMRMMAAGERPLQEVVDQVVEEWKDSFVGYTSPAAYETVDHVRDILSGLNFDITSCEVKISQVPVQSKEWLVTWLMTWLPEANYLEGIDKKRAFLQEVAERYHQDTIPLPGLVLEATLRTNH